MQSLSHFIISAVRNQLVLHQTNKIYILYIVLYSLYASAIYVNKTISYTVTTLISKVLLRRKTETEKPIKL
jgi:hypothetical protein